MKQKRSHQWYQPLIGFLFLGIICGACDKTKQNETQQDDVSETELKTEIKMSQSAAQKKLLENKSERASPPDSVSVNLGTTQIRINYSQPAVKERVIWGDLVPYDEVWRTGANEATVFEATQAISIEGKPLKAGRYALFTIPQKDKWTIIFSKNADQWGAFKYTDSEDVLRVEVQPKPLEEHVERMKFRTVSEDDKTAVVSLEWEKLQVPIKVENM